MILSSVEVDCDTCLDRLIEGASSIAEAKRAAKAIGARAYLGEYGELRHECKHCRACSERGHAMEGYSTRFAVCKRCRMSRSIMLEGNAMYSGSGALHSPIMPECLPAQPVESASCP